MELSFKEFAMIIVKKEMGKRLILDLRLTSAEQGDLLKSDELFCQHWESLFNLRELMTKVSFEEKVEVLGHHKDFILKILDEIQNRLPFVYEFLERYKAIFLMEAVI